MANAIRKFRKKQKRKRIASKKRRLEKQARDAEKAKQKAEAIKNAEIDQKLNLPPEVVGEPEQPHKSVARPARARKKNSRKGFDKDVWQKAPVKEQERKAKSVGFDRTIWQNGTSEE